MSAIVPAIEPTTIEGVIEANTNAYLLSFARLPGAVLHDDPGLVWVDSGVPDVTFNSVVYANLGAADIDGCVADVLAHFRQRSRPVTWHIGPSSRPVDLDRALVAHGMLHDEDEPGMAVEIGGMRDDFPAPPGFTIETVRDATGLETWVGIWLFGAPPDIRRLYLDALLGRGLGDSLPWRYFLGMLDGKPVAISELFAGAGVAGVQYVVTLPEARRRGIGTAMTAHVLRAGQAMGYRVGVLTSSPDGLGSYRRIGFREYCWFRRYVWGPQ